MGRTRMSPSLVPLHRHREFETLNGGLVQDRVRHGTESGLGLSQVWDRVIRGIQNQTMKERLLHETNLTLKKALDICRVADVSQAPVTSLTTANQPTLTHTNKIRHASQQSRRFLRSTNKKTQLQHFLSCPAY